MKHSTVDPSQEWLAARLYYQDPYLREFHARVVEHLTWAGHPAVVLDRTAFYPEGGGQPADQGMLNGIPVVDVQTRPEDNAIVHVLSAPLSEDRVFGRIDWNRRFDHMQQHTAQHILSQAFIQVAQAQTIGFHLGEQETTIDLDRHDLPPEHIRRAEELANRIIEENRPVRPRFVEEAELASLHVRRPAKVQGPIRVVEIEAFDVVPCGGTHVAHTGEIGLLAITHVERYKGGWRITFLAGRRARMDYARRRHLLSDLGALLTCGEEDLRARVEKLLHEQKRLASDLRKAQETLLAVEAQRLWAGGEPFGKGKLIVATYSTAPAEWVRKLAATVREYGAAVIMLGWQGTDRGRFVFAATPDMNVNVGHILRSALAEHGGRGGGRPDWAEGGMTDPHAVPLVLKTAAEMIRNLGESSTTSRT